MKSPLTKLSFCFLIVSNAFAFTTRSDHSSPFSSRRRSGKVSDSVPLLASTTRDENEIDQGISPAGTLEELKSREAELSRLLAQVRDQKRSTLKARPLSIGIVGFGRFGQFIARTFAKHGRVIVTSRGDYTEAANGMGVTFVPFTDLDRFFAEDLDVVVMAVSILSFEDMVRRISPFVHRRLDHDDNNLVAPLFVDVLSVKEHPRRTFLEVLPSDCDILCTHPMFGPDSGKNGWQGLNFIYERTRINGVVMDSQQDFHSFHHPREADSGEDDRPLQDNYLYSAHDVSFEICSDDADCMDGMDRMERFLSIWEEEGCQMVPMSCADHDAFAANSQFITHLMGRILGSQGLVPTPIDTKGFESVLKLIGTTTADSFDLFYGLYKYNQNSMDTILRLQRALNDVVADLQEMEEKESFRRNGSKWIQNGFMVEQSSSGKFPLKVETETSRVLSYCLDGNI